MIKTLSPQEEDRHLVIDFIRKTDEFDENIFTAFRNKRLSFYKLLLNTLVELNHDTGVEPYIENMIKTLMESKRYFDLASLYSFLKARYEAQEELGLLMPVLKKSLKLHINDLFVMSLTYHSDELNTLFFDILGDDRNSFIELISHILEERNLFNITLSPNIYLKFLEIADENPKAFVQHSSVHFLSFYLTILPEISFAPAKHIEKWTSLILSATTSREHLEKIIEAMKINPSVDFLFILMLVQKEDMRATAINMLWDILKKSPEKIAKYSNAMKYFLNKAITSQFYDFHQISQKQKVIISNLIFMLGDDNLMNRVVAEITEENYNNDPKQQETKKIFLALLGKFAEKDKSTMEILRNLLKDEGLDPELRQYAAKVIKTAGDARKKV